jgi:hypothetical protein
MALIGAALIVALRNGHVDKPPSPLAAVASSAKRDIPKVIARLGPTEITNRDLARYRILAQLSYGVLGDRQSLEDLCDRTLLGMAAAEANVRLGDDELNGELLRRKLLIGATALSTPMEQGGGDPPGTLAAPGRPRVPMPGAMPNGLPNASQSPLDRGDQAVQAAGLTVEDFSQEVRADALSKKVKRVLVYDKIEIPDADVKAAVSAAPAGSTPSKTPPSASDLQGIRERLQRDRGQKPLAELLARLRQKWPVTFLDR